MQTERGDLVAQAIRCLTAATDAAGSTVSIREQSSNPTTTARPHLYLNIPATRVVTDRVTVRFRFRNRWVPISHVPNR